MSFLWVLSSLASACLWGLPRWLSGKESTYQSRRNKKCEFDPWVGKIPWRRKWQPTSVFLPGKFHAQRSIAGYSSCLHRVKIRLSNWYTHTHLLLNFVFENFMFLGSKNNYLIESDILRRPTEPSFPQEEVLNFRFGAWCLVCNRFSSEERKERKSKRLAQRNSRKLIWVQSSRKRFLRRWPKHISPNITRA